MSTIQVSTISGQGHNSNQIVMEGNDHLNVNGTLSVGANGVLVLPVGGTLERPANPAAGMIRFNTTLASVEVYTGSEWVTLTTPPPAAPEQDPLPAIVAAGVQFTLVFALDKTGTVFSPNSSSFGSVAETSASVAYTPYDDIDQRQTDWQTIKFTSQNRPWTQWIFNRTFATKNVLESLCNPYAQWQMSTNSGRSVIPTIGSNARVGQSMRFQHNNNGSETHDIPTLATSTNVWSNNMVWGQIDSTSNYGGILNTPFGHSGSGGGNTEEKIFVFISDSPPDDDADDFENYMTPTGPLGDARSFSTSVYASTDDGSNSNWGSVGNVFDTISRTSTSGWQNYGIQLRGDDCYIQVDLGADNDTKFDYFFAIGYVNGNHWSSENYLDASNDGSNWTRLSQWQYHNGSTGQGYLCHTNGSHTYDNTIGNIAKWLPINNDESFRYYRIGGSNYNVSNGYLLIMNWALLKKKEDRRKLINANAVREAKVQATYPTHENEITQTRFDSDGITMWLDASNHPFVSGTADWEDKSGNEYSGAAGSYPDFAASFGQAPHFRFNGSSHFMAIRDVNYGNGSDNGTISELSAFAWVRTTYNAGTAGAYDSGNWSLIDWDRSEVFNLTIGGGGDIQFAGYSSNSGGLSTYYDIWSNSTMNDGLWHYVGVTFSVEDQEIIFWLDGERDGVYSANGNMTALGARSRRYGFIGDGSEAPSFNSSRNSIFYEGDIAEIHMWDDRKLTPEEIYMHYQATGHKYGHNPELQFAEDEVVQDGSLQMWLDAGDENSYNTSEPGVWRDLSQYGRNASVNSAAQGAYQTTNGGRFNFEGSDTSKVITMPRDSARACGADEYTMEMWIRPINNSGNQYFNSMYGNGSDNYYILQQDGSSNIGKWQGSVNVSYTSGQWMHFCVVRSRQNGNTGRFYKNGVTTGTSGNITNINQVDTWIFNQEQDSNGGGFSSSQNYRGSIAIHRLYSRALNPEEILHNYNAEKSRFGL